MQEAPHEVVIASILCWTFLYFVSRVLLPVSATYSNWDRERQYKARGLVPSSVFLLGIVPFSIWALTADAHLREVRVTGATSNSLLISAIATGYFVYDSGVVLYHLKDDGLAYLVHGILCMVTCFCGVSAGKWTGLWGVRNRCDRTSLLVFVPKTGMLFSGSPFELMEVGFVHRRAPTDWPHGIACFSFTRRHFCSSK